MLGSLSIQCLTGVLMLGLLLIVVLTCCRKYFGWADIVEAYKDILVATAVVLFLFAWIVVAVLLITKNVLWGVCNVVY